MNKKIQNLKEMEYYSNFNFVGDILLRLKKKYPDNEQIQDATEAMTQIGFYVQDLISNQYWYEHSLNQYRADKTRAIERARRAEKQLNNE